MNTKWLTTRSQQLQNPWDFGIHIRYMSSISLKFSTLLMMTTRKYHFQNKLISKLRLKLPNDMKFLSHIYSYMIYKIPKLQIQKRLNKGDMTKKPDLAQSFQKLLTLTKHILFFWNFENRSVLQSSITSPSFTPRSFHSRSRSRFKDLTSTTLICWFLLTFFLFFSFSSHFFLSSFFFCT